MAQYDGSIRINTEIATKNAKIQLATLENSISKTADKVASLRSKLDSLKTAQIPTQEYSEIAAQIEKAQHSLDGLLEKQSQMQTEGKTSGLAWERLNSKIAEARSEISYAKGELQALADAGKAFTVGNPAQEEKLSHQLQTEEARLASMTQKRDLLNSKVQAAAEEEQRLASIKENATVADQKMVDLIDRRKQLVAQIKDMEKAGVTEGYEEYDKAIADLSDVQGQINGIRDMREAAAQTRASYVSLGESVRQAGKIMARGLVDIPIASVKAGLRGLVSAFQKLGGVVRNVASSAFRMLGNAIKTSLSKVGSLVGNVVSKIKLLGSTAKKSFSTMNKSAKKSSGIFSNFSSRLKGIISSLLIFNWITKAFNAFTKSIKDGFGNLYKDNKKFKTSVDNLRASVLTLKNAFAAAFRPLVDVAIPYIQMAADKLTELLGKVGQFMAAITGQKTYTKAIKQTADAFKEAEKAADGYLSPLDEINKYSDGKSKDEDKNQFGQMFEELPIDQKIKDLADKIKDILKKLFAPIKEAWNREGKFVMDSWKYALEEIWKLAKDIGRDFLEVWNQEETINMLADMLHIIGDIGLVVGNLAGKFREAWNYNNTGLHILENIRDIFAAIVHNIREAADYTVEWTKTLDFKPLLQGIERLTASLVPFFDFVSGTLADFYTQFILPLTSWVLSEEGLPRLLNILSSFMEIVDWGALREALKSLYQALEPYAEAIGTGLLDFIEKMKDEGAEFFNYLPGAIQRAADALKSGNLPAAFEEFGSIAGEAVKHSFNMIITAIKSINWGEIGTLIASFINGIDWEGVGKSIFGALASTVNAAIDLIYNFITTTNWRSIGEQLGKSLSDAWKSIDWKKAGAAVGETFRAFFDFIASVIESIEWFAVGQKVKDFLVGIDWGSVANAFFEAIGAAIGGLGAFLGGLISDGLAAAGEYFQQKIEECGGNIVLGIFKGIQDAIKGIAEWITEHILFPFIEGFKKAFGIHSPSTVMAEMGKYIIQGLLNGILSLVGDVKAIWEGMKETAVNIWNGVKDFFGSTWNSIKQTAVQVWDGIKQSLSEKWNNIKSGAKTAFDNIKNGIKESWTNIKSNVKESAENVKTNITNAWAKAKETTASAWGNIKEKAVSSAQSMAGGVRDKFSGMQSAVSNFSSSAQSIWSRAWEGMQGKVGSVLDSVRNTISSVFGWISRTIGSLGNSLRNLTSRVISSRSTSSYSYGRNYSFAPASAPVYQSSAFDSLKNVPIPKLATGAVIPANKEFLAVLGDQKHGTNIEAPLETIKQAQVESLLEVFSRLGLTGSSAGSDIAPIILKLFMDSKIVYEAMIKEGKVRQMSTGSNDFMLGTT